MRTTLSGIKLRRTRHRCIGTGGLRVNAQAPARVYRLLKEARERGVISWHWIVDETRELERVVSWDDPAELFAASPTPIGEIFGRSS